MQAPAGFLHLLSVSENWLTEIDTDFIGPLLKSQGFDGILFTIDKLINYVWSESIEITIMTSELTNLFYLT